MTPRIWQGSTCSAKSTRARASSQIARLPAESRAICDEARARVDLAEQVEPCQILGVIDVRRQREVQLEAALLEAPDLDHGADHAIAVHEHRAGAAFSRNLDELLAGFDRP